MQDPQGKPGPAVIKFDENFDFDDYSEDSVPLNSGMATINVDEAAAATNSASTTTSTTTTTPPGMMTLYYIGVEGSTQSTTIDPSRSWALQIARVYGFPCSVGEGGLLSGERVKEYKALLRRLSFWVSALDVVMFVAALLCGGGFAGLGTNVFLGPTQRGLSAAGAKYTYSIVTGMAFYRLATAVLHHYGLAQLAVNLYAQLRLGVYAEAQWGLATYGLIYGAAGLGGVLLSAQFNPESISVGASGAMAGVLAALLVYVYAVPEPRDPIRRPALVQIGVLGVLYLVMSASPHTDFCAHLGGAAVGALLALGLWGARLETVARAGEWVKKAFPLVMYAVTALYFVIGLVVLYVYVYAEPIKVGDRVL